MTRQEISKLEIRINVVTLWSILGAIVIATFVVTSTYKDMMAEIKNIKTELNNIKEQMKK